MEHIPFKIYSASAGSGKTFTLVKEYLKICLQTQRSNTFNQILAITFTNKAASEMKARIMSSLKAFSNIESAEQTEKDMLALISSECDIDRQEISRRARQIFESILHNYSQFSIGTIDKFTHRIIRTFAQDLGLPNNFEVEMEHELLLKKAVDILISRTGENEKLTKVFVSFIKDKTAEDKSWLIENDFYAVAKELLKESGQEHCDSLKSLTLDDFFELKKALNKYISGFDRQLTEIGQSFELSCSNKQLKASWFRGGARSGITKYFEYLRTKNWEKYIPSQSNLKNLEAENWYAGSAPSTSYGDIDAIQNKFLPAYHNVLELLNDYPKYVQFRLIEKNFYAMTVLHEISKEMELIKAQSNTIPIGEFNKKIAQVLQGEEGNFIYERLGERYANYFIDEFQDTSQLQWNNLLPLIENAIADTLKPGTAMLVGDAKQAIYRWRGGEVDQFIALQDKAKDSRLQTAYRMQSMHLENNYRSGAEIVNFNNKLFRSISHLIQNESYSALFKQLKAKANKKTGGYVSLEYIPHDTNHNQIQKQRCLDCISELITDGYNYGDICILTRTKAHGAEIVKMVSDENIPVISSESLLIEQSPEVRFLLNFLKFLNQPDHPRYRFKIIAYLYEVGLCPWTLETPHLKLQYLCKCPSKEFNTFLKDIVDDFDMQRWRSFSLVELCHTIIKTLNLEKRARVYMQFFLDELLVFSNKQSQDLHGFINYWEERAHKLSIAIPEGINAVQVMTIHKSKGLEFPVVIFPFANWNASSEPHPKVWVKTAYPELKNLSTTLIPINKNLDRASKSLQNIYSEHKSKVLLDNLNMLYVALTRPKDRLYIFSSPKNKTKNLSSYFDVFLKSEDLWEDSKSRYEFGSKTKRREELKLKNKYIDVAEPIKNLTKILRVSRQAPKIWDIENPEKGIALGKKVHQVLSYITTEDDIDAALKKSLQTGFILHEDVKDIRHLLVTLIKESEAKKYFTHGLKIKNEEDILLQDGSVLRPDRLIFEKEHISIIDYKTGKPKKEHRQQLLNYQAHIETMGYKVKEAVLIYINKDSVKLMRA